MDTQNLRNQPDGPFSCSYSPNLPELLVKLNCTIAISTYQAGKVVFLSAQNADSLIQLPRNFNHAMALGIDGNRLAVAAKHAVVVLAHEPGLAGGYPKQPNTYDSLYVPRASYYTGAVDIHGLEWGREGLWAVGIAGIVADKRVQIAVIINFHETRRREITRIGQAEGVGDGSRKAGGSLPSVFVPLRL